MRFIIKIESIAVENNGFVKLHRINGYVERLEGLRVYQ